MNKMLVVITSCLFFLLSVPAQGNARWLEDFEATNGGFVADPSSDAWEWGIIMSGPGTAHSGTNVWATNLEDNYGHRADWKITSQENYIATENNPHISFYHWHMFENLYDGGNVKFSADSGATWSLLHPVNGYDGVADSGNAGIPAESCFTGFNMNWAEEEFIIPVNTGQTIKLRLHFGSDNVVHYPGWYVDDLSGNGLVGIEEGATAIPAGEYALFAAEPNPMIQATRIAFYLPHADVVTLRVYDIQGRLTATLLCDAKLPAGSNDVVWRGTDTMDRALPAGVYYYELKTPEYRAQEKLIITR